ncbi:unnamed protein product [Gordionus sp. m RMFG-2023]
MNFYRNTFCHEESQSNNKDPCRTILRDDELDLIGCGYELSRPKQFMTWVCILLTVGLLRLIFHWKHQWFLKWTHNICPLDRCTKILLQDQYGQYFVEDIMIKRLDKVANSLNIKTTVDYKDTAKLKKHDSDEQMMVLSEEKENLHLKQTSEEANHNYLFDENYQYFTPTLVKILKQPTIRFFINKKIKYVWLTEEKDFEQLKGIEEGMLCSNFYKMQILSLDERCKRRNLYEQNEIHIEITSRLTLLFLEVLNPFYIFQVYSCILWIFQDYYYFVSYIICLSIILITITIRRTRKMQMDLRDLVTMNGTVQIFTSLKNILTITYEELVPGDIMLVPENESTMLCDAVVLSGSVIVNESMLTGESVAFTKTPLSPEDKIFNIKMESKSILFNGTKILQTRSSHGEPVKALVIRTGFMTLKGQLIQSILFPKPIDFKFNKHTYKFIGVLALIAMIGFFYTLGLMIISHKADPLTIAIRALDLITITVSPALPISMAVGVIYAQSRLKKLGVFCISPKTINIVASLNLICFDKTGTITMEDLDMLGVVPIDRDNHFESCQDIIGLTFSPLLKGLICCHSLTKLDGKFIGDPLDIKMFNATHWIMKDSYEIIEDNFKINVVAEFYKSTNSKTLDKMPKLGVIKQFPFTSSSQSMSVLLIQEYSDKLEFYIKGSPEKLATICTPESMPKNFAEELMHYTQQGYRVIALAWKSIVVNNLTKDIPNLTRNDLEKDMIFSGFMILENRPKSDSRQVIQLLQDADLRTVMITGDNLYTALCVAKDVDMIQQNENVIIVEAIENKGTLKTEINESKPLIMYRYAKKGHFYSQNIEKRRSSVYKPRTKEELESLELVSKKIHRNRYHFALNGKTLKAIQTWHPYLLPKILSRGTVFARMSPEQKAQLIESFQSLGYYVGMCGDGANDCGALKMAHAGISLSENESSIASPFTSKTQSITCVPLLLREGRAALTTSFGIFKYLASYSMVQFVSVTILYWVKASLTDFEYLYVDLFEMMFLAITFGRTLAYPYLSKERPPLSLISFMPIFSIISCLVINVCAQLTVFIMVTKQPWFEPLVPTHTKDYYSYQNACVFTISNFQYIILAVIFSKGPPFRMPLYTNYWFIAAVVILLTVSSYILLFGHPKLLMFLQYREIPDMNFKLLILAVVAVNSLLLILNEKILVQRVLKNTLNKYIQKRKSSKYPYQRLEKEMSSIEPDSIVNIGLEPSTHFINLGSGESDYGYNFETESAKPETLKSTGLLKKQMNLDFTQNLDSVRIGNINGHGEEYLNKNNNNSNNLFEKIYRNDSHGPKRAILICKQNNTHLLFPLFRCNF